MKCRYYLFVWWECLSHIKRKKTEEKASVLGRGNNLFNSLPRTILKNRMNSSFSFKSSWCIHPRQGKELNKFFPTNRSDDLCLFFCLYPSMDGPCNTGWQNRTIVNIHYTGTLGYSVKTVSVVDYDDKGPRNSVMLSMSTPLGRRPSKETLAVVDY